MTSFDFGFLRLEEVRDHAGALVRARRAAVGVAGHRHDDDAAVVHRLELLHQQQRLRAGLPGVRHDLGRRGRIAFDGAVVEVDAGRQHEPVVGQRLAAGERDALLAGIDRRRRVVDDR